MSAISLIDDKSPDKSGLLLSLISPRNRFNPWFSSPCLMTINVDMKDIHLEKSLESLYDECINEMSPGKCKMCVWAVKMGQPLSSLKDETN